MTTRILDRAVIGVGICLAALSVLTTVVQMLALEDARVGDLVAVAFVAVAIGVATLDLLRGRRRSTALGAYAVAGLVVMPLALLVPRPGPGSVYPPLMYLAAPAVAVSVLLFRRWEWAVLVHALVVPFLRAPVVGWPQALLETLAHSNTMVAIRVGRSMLYEAATDVEAASRRLWRAQEDLARAAARLDEQERWKGIVHDKILGSLRLVGRATSAESDRHARLLAAEAVDALTARSRSTEEIALGEHILHLGARLGLDLDLDVRGTCSDPDVTDALARAAEAALTNVALHSGECRARVVGAVDEVAAEVTITDAGAGFDPRMVSPRGLGLTHGIESRMNAVGGTASVVSSPGAGTTVTLRWRRSDSLRVAATHGWDRSRYWPAIGCGTVALVVPLWIGALNLRHFRSPPTVLAAMAVVVITTALLAFLPTRHAWASWVIVGVQALTVGVLGSLLLHPEVDDWRYWFIPGLIAPLAALSLRWPVATAPALVVLAAIALVTAHAGQGRIHLSSIDSGLTAVVAHLIPFLGVRGALRSTTLRIAERDSRRGYARLAAAAADARVGHIASRARRLDAAVVPILQDLADGVELTPDLRSRCLTLERTIRDELLADSLLDDDLRAAIAAARTRGVIVELVVEGRRGAVEVFRRLVGIVVGAAPSGSTVRARYRADATGRIGSLAVIDAPGRARWVRQAERQARAAIRTSDELEVTADENTVLWLLSGALDGAPEVPTPRTPLDSRPLPAGPWARP